MIISGWAPADAWRHAGRAEPLGGAPNGRLSTSWCVGLMAPLLSRGRRKRGFLKEARAFEGFGWNEARALKETGDGPRD